MLFYDEAEESCCFLSLSLSLPITFETNFTSDIFMSHVSEDVKDMDRDKFIEPYRIRKSLLNQFCGYWKLREYGEKNEKRKS